MFNDLEACIELTDSLQVRINKYEETVNKAIDIIGKQDIQLDNLLNQVNLEAAMLEVCDNVEKKQEKKIKFLKFTRNIAICAAGLEACYIGVKLAFQK